MQTAELIADLERGLAAAKELAAQGPPETKAPSIAAAADTSQMPGGVDSAPVNEPDPHTAPLTPTANAQVAGFELAETEGLDLLAKLKDGATVEEVSALLHDAASEPFVKAIVKAIADVAQGVRI